MNILKEKLYEKLQEIIPELVKDLNLTILSSVCDNKTVQPFLKWFVDNVGQQNFLSEEEIELAKEVKNSKKWLTGAELDAELEEALKDYPEMEEFFYSDSNNINLHVVEYETEKEEYTKDLEYLKFLEHQYKQLKKEEDQLEEQLENDETVIEKQLVEVEISYNKCKDLLEKFNNGFQEFSSNLQQLLEIYNDKSNKRTVCSWVQIPLDNFLKQLETYSNSLDVYIKNQFGDRINFQNFQSDQLSFNISDSYSETMLSAKNYKFILSQSKYEEILHKVEKDAMTEIVEQHLYNGKLSQVLKNFNQSRSELQDMNRKKDFMEENLNMLLVQLKDGSNIFGEKEMNKFLLEVAQDRYTFQQQRLEKLENLVYLARENGHAYSDLLCLLMSSQRLLFSELYHFAKDAQHYLQSEYTLTEKRTEKMLKLQNDLMKNLMSHTNEQNVFNKLFLNLMGYDNSTDIYKCIQDYELLGNENEKKKRVDLEDKYSSVLEEIEKLDHEISKLYVEELDNGLTRNFQLTDNLISSKLDETKTKVDNCQSELQTIHRKIKDVAKKINDSTLQRETVILWQRFLAAPNLLQAYYDDLQTKADKTHFVNNL